MRKENKKLKIEQVQDFQKQFVKEGSKSGEISLAKIRTQQEPDSVE